MSPRLRISLFAVGLAAVLVAGFGVGSAVDKAETDSGGSHDDHQAEHGEAEHGGHEVESAAPAGLAVAAGGYSLHLERTSFAAGEARELRFRIEDADGNPVRDFDRLHERELHLIVVRRDGAHFQHLHPEMDAAGTWATPLTLPAAGVYRVFADFSAGGEGQTLATDLFAAGSFEPRPFPPPEPADAVAGYEVRLADGMPKAGKASSLRFAVSRGGTEVSGLEDYLGAKGHLVALREGDLAFLHVHPDEGGAENVIPFSGHFPTPGRYRLYLQFKHEGQVRTVEFTVEVAG
jgi:hypothetical protein